MVQIKEAQLAKSSPHPRRHVKTFVYPATDSVYLFVLQSHVNLLIAWITLWLLEWCHAEEPLAFLLQEGF